MMYFLCFYRQDFGWAELKYEKLMNLVLFIYLEPSLEMKGDYITLVYPTLGVLFAFLILHYIVLSYK